ncbi:MAG: DUF6526 family protein [Acidobacteriota bacterium]
MQNYKNHAKFVPAFHFVALPILLANFLYACYQFRWGYSNGRVATVATAVALILFAATTRAMVMAVQDRVIRLEMRLRLRALLSADMHGKIDGLTPKQMVGLRFASDAELPSLVSQVLKDNITSADAIKKMVQNWQADDARA